MKKVIIRYANLVNIENVIYIKKDKLFDPDPHSLSFESERAYWLKDYKTLQLTCTAQQLRWNWYKQL